MPLFIVLPYYYDPPSIQPPSILTLIVSLSIIKDLLPKSLLPLPTTPSNASLIVVHTGAGDCRPVPSDRGASDGHQGAIRSRADPGQR